jgi:hypothetical protein
MYHNQISDRLTQRRRRAATSRHWNLSLEMAATLFAPHTYEHVETSLKGRQDSREARVYVQVKDYHPTQ